MNFHEFKVNISEEIKALVPEERLAKIIENFVNLDSNQDGKIEIDEYINFYLTEKKINLTRKFERLDTNKDGIVDFQEFVAASEPTFNILKRFRELDLDHNDLLSIEEALSIADQLVLPLSIEQVKAIVKEADHDGDGQVTYYEYLGAITHLGFQ
jgi:Ca2+-binding EF-hand superfamily protein